MLYLWLMYLQVARGRRYGVNGPEPLTWLDFDAYARVMDRPLLPREIEALMDVDVALLQGMIKRE